MTGTQNSQLGLPLQRRGCCGAQLLLSVFYTAVGWEGLTNQRQGSEALRSATQVPLQACSLLLPCIGWVAALTTWMECWQPVGTR